MIPLKDNVPSRTFPYINLFLIFLNVFFFFYELSLGKELSFFLRKFGLIPARYLALSQTHPLLLKERFFPFFSSMFLHGGWLHLFGNMLYLWIFGDNVEDRLGHLRYLIFYLLSGIGASLVHIYLNPSSRLPSIGASGAIAGVMGAYFTLYPRARVITLLPFFFFFYLVEIPAFFFLGFWFLLQFVSGSIALLTPLPQGGIAWWAHVGGFLFGATFNFLFRKPKRSYPFLT